MKHKGPYENRSLEAVAWPVPGAERDTGFKETEKSGVAVHNEQEKAQRLGDRSQMMEGLPGPQVSKAKLYSKGHGRRLMYVT